MNTMRLTNLLLTCGFLLSTFTTLAQDAPKTIYSYAVGNWRNGPTVVISPLFETTEQASTPQLIARVKKDYPAFKDITDIDVQRFATTEEGNDSRTTLRSKYLMRKLEVLMVEPETK
ncbi:MAG: hypothetical protein IPN85_02455 [Flavobacteriales bacterium]|nr:hypothetical protein [Flavobacteriales bacterium]MBK9287241.1 hypothetical protein [Flavobacteriales bacterium]MBL0034304.1 hypothetical protein [Flavobacteriales bacterium]